MQLPGLETNYLVLKQYYKIEGEIPSIEGVFITNNLPFGKFKINLTLPEKLFVVILQRGNEESESMTDQYFMFL